MKTQRINVWVATGAVVLATVLASTVEATQLLNLNFNHGEHLSSTEPTYVPASGEFLNGATFTWNDQNTAGQSKGVFTNTPSGGPVTGGGQSWFNAVENDSQGYRTLNLAPVTGSFTLETLIYLNTTNQPIQYVAFGQSGVRGSGYSDFTIYGDTPEFSILSPGEDATSSSIKVTPNKWYHLAFVWDQAQSKKFIYVNGQLGASTAFGGPADYCSISNSLDIAGIYFTDRNLNGYMDAFAISDTALGPTSFVLWPVPESSVTYLIMVGGIGVFMRSRRLAAKTK